MKTLLYKNVDSHKILIGFSNPVVDPKATEKLINPLVEQTIEHKAWADKLKEVQVKTNRGRDILNEARKLKMAGKDSESQKLGIDYEDNQKVIKMLMDELGPLAGAVGEKAREFYHSNAVHFEPKSGEVLITEQEQIDLLGKIKLMSEFEIMSIKLTEGAFKKGKVLPNYKGQSYYINGDKWVKSSILEIGTDLPAEAVLESDLSEDQKVEISKQDALDYLKGLSVAELEAAKLSEINSALAESVNYKIGLEIQGNADALVKSQAFYTEKVAEIEAKYSNL